MNSLELFAGSRSFGKVAVEKGFKNFSVDWKNYDNIDLVSDIEFLTIEQIPFLPDLIWASPDCTSYSVAAIWKHRKSTIAISEYAIKSDRVNYRLFGLIREYLKVNPSLIFFIENPRGMYRKMEFVKGIRRVTVWYCKYGDFRAKPTDIFTNSSVWFGRSPCKRNNEFCSHEKSPKGSNLGTTRLNGSYERSKIPIPLITEIIDSVLDPIHSNNSDSNVFDFNFGGNR